jgi:ubiquitin C-terminal hydrolase
MLTIRIRRLVYDRVSTQLEYISTPVIPDLKIEVNHVWVCDASVNESQSYDLAAITVQLGDVNGGHYVSFSRDAGGCWYRCSDEDVTLIGKNLQDANAFEDEIVCRGVVP